MSLNAVRLGTAIKSAMIANGAVDNPATAAWSLAIATAIVTEITGNASVVPTLLVAPTGGGPVTGTGTVT